MYNMSYFRNMFIQKTSTTKSQRNTSCGKARVPFLTPASYSSITNCYSACDDNKTTAAPHSYPGCFLRSVAFWLGPASRDTRLGIFHTCNSTSTLQDVLTAFTEVSECMYFTLRYVCKVTCMLIVIEDGT